MGNSFNRYRPLWIISQYDWIGKRFVNNITNGSGWWNIRHLNVYSSSPVGLKCGENSGTFAQYT